MSKNNDCLNESIKLRDYSKNLLNALKLQQLSINQTLNASATSATIPPDYNNKTKEFKSLELNTLISNINNFKTQITNAVITSPTTTTSTIALQKSVSFSEYLVASPRRRAKSVPPKLNENQNKNKKKIKAKTRKSKKLNPKSILKKQQNQFSSFDTTDTDSMDDETKTLYNEINDFYLKNNEYYINLKDINKNDKKTMVDCLTKTRQKYLNHVYNDSYDSNMGDGRKNEIIIKGLNENKKLKEISKKKSNNSSAASIHNRKVDEEFKSLSDSEENKKSIKHKHKRSTFSIKNIPKKNKPLLGYDWIKDALENGNNVSFNQSDSYWNDLINFRNSNRNDCVSKENYNDTTTFFEHESTLQEDDPDNLRHKCIHTYTINERLFAVPTYVGDNGESICPVCKSSRKEPTSYEPQFCKISIPQSRLYSSYKIQPQKRSQYEREDTLSLAEHCVAGFESSNENPALKPPKAKTVDLKSATGKPSDLVKFTIDDVKKVAANKDPAASLYNKGHAMRYELENQHQKRLRELAPKIRIK